ncbi:MAG: hypothetical protein ACI9YM_001664 [Brevundimonas sp.]|jgi:hypothetical protein
MGDPFSGPEVALRSRSECLVSSFSRGSFGRSGFNGGSGGIRSGSGVHGGRVGGNGGGVGSGSGGVGRFSGGLGGGLAGGDGQSEGGGSRNGQQLTDGHEVTPELESNGGNPRRPFGNAFVRLHASPLLFGVFRETGARDRWGRRAPDQAPSAGMFDRVSSISRKEGWEGDGISPRPISTEIWAALPCRWATRTERMIR